MIVLAISVSAAEAATWTLKDVVFDDGGSASGSFDYTGGAFSNINITTSGDWGFTYTDVHLYSASEPSNLYLSNIKDYDGSPIWDGGKRLVLFFGPPLGFHGNDEHPAEIGESKFTCATISATVCPSGFLTAGLVGMERAWCRAFRCLLRLGCLEVR